ncbi:YhgE/Pip domain-containing protein [Microcella alkalica]|uniref:YhgE/Pip domain-containing protein n=1 Tax=Microcella alkalica TaxID=355930 RepID=UPI00145D1015|nr:YhgE/Pip family protein [Microcella alkalica]
MTASTPSARPGRSGARGARRWAGIVAAVLVPLGLVGAALAAVGDADEALDRIPAAVVNGDELVTTTGPDGEEQPVFAGRQLVTELTGPDAAGFDWRATSAEQAAADLASGEVLAVLTIPEGFSASLLTVGTPEQEIAPITVETDDAHSYLAGTIVEAVGASLAQQFGDTVTAQYLAGLQSGLGELGSALGEAADGASQVGGGIAEVGSGASALGDGIAALGSGASASAQGARELATGLERYTGGVAGLSSGLAQLDRGAAGLDQLAQAVTGADQLAQATAAQLTALVAAVQASNLSDADKQAFIAALTSAQTAAGTTGAIAPQLQGAIDGVQGGIADSAEGAAALAGGGPALVQGADALADGLGALSSGAAEASAGAGELAAGADALAAGADELAAGLADGAAQVPESGDAELAASPVAVEAERANAVDGLGGVLAATLVPIGLWLGALATMLVVRPAASAVVGTAATAGAMLRRVLARASLVAAGQAVAVTVLLLATGVIGLDLALGVLGLTLVIALALTALHAALVLGLGPAGLTVSLLLLAVQLVAAGGLVPVVALAEPFPTLSGVLPLSAAVDGLQALLAGGDPARIGAALGAMLVLGALSLVVARLAIGRSRRREALAAFAPGALAARA